jgi:hypothetical protein
VLGVGAEALPLLQNLDADIKQLELYQSLKAQNVQPDETLMRWYKESKCTDEDNLLYALRYTTPHKLMRYINKQFDRQKEREIYGVQRYDRPGRVLSEYNDYLNMGENLEYDFSDNFVLFPKNLIEAHDKASMLYDTNKKAIFDKKIREAYENLGEQYHFSKNGFTIVPPRTANEIVEEGHTLHHCVHTYVERVAKGKCVILFIRQNDNIKKPFYTVEVQDSRVIQIHGSQHCKPTPEVQNFLDLWERTKLHTANMPMAA